MKNRHRGWVVALTFAVAAGSSASEPVAIELPLPARLDLTGYRSVTVAPFIVGVADGSSPVDDVETELTRYLARTIERRTELAVDTLTVDLPSHQPEELASNSAFWRYVAERTGSDLILAGAVDYDIRDRSGYVTREMISESDGRTYYAQVLVESTGVELDLLVWVIDGRDGRLLLRDNFKAFRSGAGERLDPSRGLFAGLPELEDRLLGIFQRRQVTATRILQ